MQASFIVETVRPMRKMRPFTRFWWKLSVISLLLELYRRLNAISIAYHTPNAMHAVFSVETSKPFSKNASIYSILKKTKRYFAILTDITTFKRYIHCILHAECYAR